MVKIRNNTIKLINEKDIRNDVRIIFKNTSRLLKKLAPYAKIEHVGSTAIPGSLTKGDIDIQIRISQSQFAKAKKILSEHFEIDINNPATKNYAGFVDIKSKNPLNIQLTTINSEFDDFYKIRDILTKDKRLLKEYNAIKAKCYNKSTDVYREKKERFYNRILNENKSIKTMIKLIIFDWDDVFMLGAAKAYYKCYHLAISKVGVKLTKKEERKRIIAKWGKHYSEELRELLKEKPALLNKAIKTYENHAFGSIFIDSLKLIPDAKTLLKKLSNKYILAINTGNHPKTLKLIFKKYKIPQVFSLILTSFDIKDVKNQKPNPYGIKLILKKLNVKPNETVFVGDAHSDVKMAQAANVTPIVVLTGHLTKSEAKKLNVKYIVKDVTEIEKVLEKNEKNLC